METILVFSIIGIKCLIIDEQTTGIDGTMVSVLASNAVDPGFELRSGQTKDNKIDICLSATHTALKNNTKD